MIQASDINLCAKSNEFLCREDATRNMIRISKSGRDTFSKCKQAYYFRYICHIKLKDQHKPNALKMGSIFDEFMQYVYNGKSFKDRFAELYEFYQLDLYDAARMEAIFKAYYMLGLKHEQGGELQPPFEFIDGKAVINGVLDVKYVDHFEEIKFSGSPDWYLNPFNVADQLATYFISDENLKTCNMKVVRRPQEKVKKNEGLEEFGERVLGNILSKPSHYFLGYNRAENTFGINYYRDEFSPLTSVLEDYSMVTADILEHIERSWWYQEKKSCYRFGPDNACEYLDICTVGNGMVDEEKYDIGGK